jgi:D-alanyl-lipoteichoic acid acyltransferase DltB (MBOAT superfamily)
MLFNSLDFLVFFVIVLLLYPFLSHRRQNQMLLVASYYFYGSWDWRYLGLIFTTSVVDFYAGYRMSKTDDPRARKGWLAMSVIYNLTVLCFFKYLNFFIHSAADFLTALGLQPNLPTLRIVLPVGISFFVFQSMSYSIDVYRRQTKPVLWLPDYLLFVSFFPQLVAGPIERSGHLSAQLQSPRTMTASGVYTGLSLMLWGLFKKVAVADNLALYVDAVYSNSDRHGGITLLFATYLFAFQIYCDFSAYSDMAIGMARILGVDLMTNFQTPYFSTNVQEFWRRWHISLSTWFRDYVYLPLGGNRVSPRRTQLNTMAVFLISGLWHGANWTYVFWGGLHGAYLVLQRAFTPAREGRPLPPVWWKKGVKIFVTFNLVCLAWVFFRASSLTQAFQILHTIFTTPGTLFWDSWLVNGLFCMVLLLSFEIFIEPRPFDQGMVIRPAWAHLAVGLLLVFTVVLFGSKTGAQFIYFQF